MCLRQQPTAPWRSGAATPAHLIPEHPSLPAPLLACWWCFDRDAIPGERKFERSVVAVGPEARPIDRLIDRPKPIATEQDAFHGTDFGSWNHKFGPAEDAT